MNIDSSFQNGFRIFEIKDRIIADTNLDELIDVVKGALQQHEPHIAFSFTKESFLFSDSIRSIMSCFDLIQKGGGSLAIIQSNEDIQSLMKMLSLDSVIKVFPSKEDLLNAEG